MSQGSDHGPVGDGIRRNSWHRFTVCERQAGADRQGRAAEKCNAICELGRSRRRTGTLPRCRHGHLCVGSCSRGHGQRLLEQVCCGSPSREVDGGCRTVDVVSGETHTAHVVPPAELENVRTGVGWPTHPGAWTIRCPASGGEAGYRSQRATRRSTIDNHAVGYQTRHAGGHLRHTAGHAERRRQPA